ncbi:hypothetical protein PVAP13_3NG181470 [Panicum virgatum]|uniref:Uncharacterized protein n=1 Tax=Panicum virgatum TaxID=38727 RepID=A0A8T0U5E6_PANVG|nr:hypothetical protein PVAP13_3NG181470 [Panicum virgatum]
MRPSAVRTLQTWRLEQCSAAAGRRFEEQCGRRSFPGLEEQRRQVELPRRGGAALAGGPSGGEEQSRRVDLQAGRSRAGTGGESRGAGRGAAGGIGETSREVEAAGRGEGNSR